jgi:membrane-bound lytic murein transglycosylase B
VSRGAAILLVAALTSAGALAGAANAVDVTPVDIPAPALAALGLDVARPLTTAPAYLNTAEHLAHAQVREADDAPAKKKKPPTPNRKAEKAQAEVAAARPLPDGPSPSGPLGIPERAMTAYRVAADGYGSSCQLSWDVIAAIGRAESGHANGGRLYPDGFTWEPILGPVLDGSPFAAIRDSDDGAFDGDKTWDRAVGPMQFIPGTWSWIGVDADGDGTADPNDIDDAAAGTARYLCAHGGDLTDTDQLRTAILRYNNSGAYADAVIAWADGYAGRATIVADPESPPKPKKTSEKTPGTESDEKPDKKTDESKRDAAPTPTPKPSPTPKPTPSTPATPTPAPKPSPTPTPAPTPTTSPSPSPTPTQGTAPPAPGVDGAAPAATANAVVSESTDG